MYGNGATRPRNMTQLPTFDDQDMDETMNARPCRAPPVGPRQAEDVEVSISTDVPGELVQRLLWLTQVCAVPT